MHLIKVGTEKFFFDGTGLVLTLPPYKLLQIFFSKGSLKDTFDAKFLESSTKGLDRLNGFQFNQQLDNHLSIIHRKSLSGTYKFTPYAEVLQLKGRGKKPRVIGIPTIRDRLVLHQLKEILAHIFPECVPKIRANTLIHRISREIKKIEEEHSTAATRVFGCDIQGFYDEIDRNLLLQALQKRIKSRKLINLIKSAITCPIVPRNYRCDKTGDYLTLKGVPQGLAISNILAAIYLADFDTTMRKTPVHYYRYVDDILVFGDEASVAEAQKNTEDSLNTLDLKIHPIGSGKSHTGLLTESFGYLGYWFSVPKITVRPTTVERFLQSIVGKFSDFTHNKYYKLEQRKYLTEERLKEIFISELNERITGAISENRRFGWISYFSEITDLELLKRLDRIIAGFFTRLDDFQRKPPKDLKKITRAYYEMRYSPTSGYIHNYDNLDDRTKKMQFLMDRGRLDPNSTYTDQEIYEKFDSYRNKILADLEPDDGTMYL